LKKSVNSYSRVTSETITLGILNGRRPEPSLDQARRELSVTLSKVAEKFLANRYGPLVQNVSEEAIDSTLRAFEERLIRTKGDITLVLEELTERISKRANKSKQ